MTQLFGSLYADSYDTLYKDKNYSAECDLLESIFRQYAPQPVKTVLDLGCGTGNHALILSERGYDVFGVDRSPEMIAKAHLKSENVKGKRPTWKCDDIKNFRANRTFDAVLIMFAVLGYQLTNEDVLTTLATARTHLKPGGLLAFDVWYGPAVLNEKPSQRVKVIPTERGQILRVSSGALDTFTETCTVNYLLWNLEANRPVEYTEESHVMRYFFPQELQLFLRSSSFRAERTGAFPEFHKDPDQTTWNVLQIATAV